MKLPSNKAIANLTYVLSFIVTLGWAHRAYSADGSVAAASPPLTQSANTPANTPPLAPTNALIIFYRTEHFEGSAIGGRIRVGDRQFCEISNHDVCTVEYAAGPVVFRVDDAMSFGHLDFPLNLEAGKVYYVEISAKSGFSGGAAGYLLSNHDVPQNSSCEWGWCAAAMPEDAAQADFRNEKLFPSIPSWWHVPEATPPSP